MIIMIQVGDRELRSYHVNRSKHKPFTGDYINVKSEKTIHEVAERIHITEYHPLTDTFVAVLAPKHVKVGFTASTDHSSDFILLHDPRYKSIVISYELYHVENTVTFECYSDHPVPEEKDEVDQVLNAELDRLQYKLYGHIVDERELLRRAMVLLRVPRRAKRLALALEIQHHLANLP